MKTGFLLLLAATLVACSSESVYEGFKAREATRDPVAGPPAASRLPPYRDYDAERKKLLDPNR